VRNVKKAAMIIALSVQLAPALLIQIIVIFVLKIETDIVDSNGLLPASALTSAAFAFTVIATVWKILFLVILHVTREHQVPSPYHHTLLFCGAQWRTNRAPMGYDPSAAARPQPPLPGYGGYEAEGGAELGGVEFSEGCQSVYDPEHGGKDMTTTTSVASSGDLTQDQYGAQDQYGGQLVEATCLERALFTTPDRINGIFIQLPVSEGDEMPYLFVQVHEVKQQSRPRFGSQRNAKVTIVFNSVDVGGLDREFVEQSVCNDPGKAWATLSQFQSGHDFQSGITVDEPAVATSPAPNLALPLSAPPAIPPISATPPPEVMTPRTAAAQRL